MSAQHSTTKHSIDRIISVGAKTQEDWITRVDGTLDLELGTMPHAEEEDMPDDDPFFNEEKDVPDMTPRKPKEQDDIIDDQLAQLVFFREEGVDIDGDDASPDKDENSDGLLDEEDGDGDDIDDDVLKKFDDADYRVGIEKMLDDVEDMLLHAGRHKHHVLADA